MASIFPSFVEEVKAIEQNQNNTHSHTITAIKHKSCLQVGDSVLLYRIGDKYAVLGVVE